MLNKNDAFTDLEIHNVAVDFLSLSSTDAIIFFNEKACRVAINSNKQYSSSSLFWILENALDIIKEEREKGFKTKFITISNATDVNERVLSRFKVFEIIQKIFDLGANEQEIIESIKIPEFVLKKAREYEKAMPKFPNKLKEIMKLSEMDATELSLHLNTSIAVVIEMMNERAYIDAVMMVKLCNLFELQPKDILGYECA